VVTEMKGKRQRAKGKGQNWGAQRTFLLTFDLCILPFDFGFGF